MVYLYQGFATWKTANRTQDEEISVNLLQCSESVIKIKMATLRYYMFLLLLLIQSVVNNNHIIYIIVGVFFYFY